MKLSHVTRMIGAKVLSDALRKVFSRKNKHLNFDQSCMESECFVVKERKISSRQKENSLCLKEKSNKYL